VDKRHQDERAMGQQKYGPTFGHRKSINGGRASEIKGRDVEGVKTMRKEGLGEICPNPGRWFVEPYMGICAGWCITP
jgi:hypothetical protein